MSVHRSVPIYLFLLMATATTYAAVWRQTNEAADCYFKCEGKRGSCPNFCGVGGFCCHNGHDGCPAGAAEASPSYSRCVKKTEVLDPILLHEENKISYYKVPVPESSQMTSATVLKTCTSKGLTPPCFQFNQSSYDDDNCLRVPDCQDDKYGECSRKISQILCSTTDPKKCRSILNVFWYMGSSWDSGSACGTTETNGYCSKGNNFISTTKKQLFAACVGVTTDTTTAPVLLHTDANYQYYKVPVPASSKMTSALVLTTCTSKGMTPQCFSSGTADNNCVKAPNPHRIHYFYPILSKIWCSTPWPPICATTVNMFWYMNAGWESGSACGATIAGGMCTKGRYITSTSDGQYFAACLKPV